MNRREFLSNGIKGVLGLSLTRGVDLQASSEFDLLIQGGTVLDGTGGPEWKADVAIIRDTIVAVGQIPQNRARKVIDATNFYVSPGFIDIHSHSDYSLPAYPTADSRIRQGITTEITGNCGSSVAPLIGMQKQAVLDELLQDYGYRADWTDVASYFAHLEKKRFSPNQALLIGQGTIRASVIGEVDRKLSADELKEVLRLVEEGLDQGAIGLSTGLEYTPGIYTPTEELIEMVRIVARRGGLYASHIRNEEIHVLEAIDEAIEIGRRTGVRVEISHLKTAGRINWTKQEASLRLIEAAREDGIQVLADAYPYTAYSTGLTVLLKPWVRDGGATAILERLRDQTQREKIRKEVDHHITTNDPGSYDLIVISSLPSQTNQVCVGKNLQQIAEMWKLEPVDAYLRLLEEEQCQVSYIGFGMSPANVERVLSHPLVMVSSDGYSMAPTGKAAQSQPHPRSYGTYPRFLNHYVRDRKVVELPEAIRKSTSMPADQSGLSDRGRIGRHKKADLVIFDWNRIRDEATYEKPHQYASGIIHVLVNGTPVIQNGEHTGATPGQILRKA